MSALELLPGALAAQVRRLIADGYRPDEAAAEIEQLGRRAGWTTAGPFRPGRWTPHERRIVLDAALELGGTAQAQRSPGRPSGPEWVAIVRAYRATGTTRPGAGLVAERLGITTRTLRKRTSDLGIRSWHDVHALVATET